MSDAGGARGCQPRGARRRSPDRLALLLLAAAIVWSCAACGKKGPPLPPLVKVPVAPPDLTASRRGDIVDLQFTVPATNTDGSRPANVDRVEVYAVTTAAGAPPSTLTDAQFAKYGTRIDVVAVKAPRDPNLTADPDEPSEEVEPPQGDGLDQGAIAHVEEALGDDAMEPTEVPHEGQTAKPTDGNEDRGLPLVAPIADPPQRTYAVVGVSTRGKKGPVSKRVAVPLAPPPPPPEAPTIDYTEHEITVTWPPANATVPADGEDVLPSRPLGPPKPPVEYTVYDASDPAALTKLTPSPIANPKYTDRRIAWGEKRCYTVRSTVRMGSATIESDPGPPECKMLVDSFAPAAPKGVAAISAAGAINLIWEPNTESDLAGYIVLRGTPHEGATETPELEPIGAPITATLFTDAVAAGTTHVYAVQAIDRAGNVSPASAPVTETAR